MAENVVIKQEKNSDSALAGSSLSQESPSEAEAEARILELLRQFPKGITDKILTNDMPTLNPKIKVTILNKFLSQGKVDLFKVANELHYRLKEQLGNKYKGSDNEEKVVLRIIEEAGNKGIWARDIRVKSGLNQQALNKVLKSLEGKKHIKSVSSVSAAKKKVYMLFDLEPDRSITGGSWYSDNEFESEFVEILNQQCYRMLVQKAETARSLSSAGPLMTRNASYLSSKEIWQYITDLKISKVPLTVEDIEMILDTLVYDGKVEKTIVSDGSNGEQVKTYRSVDKLLYSAGFVRIPCGVCPVTKSCGPVGSVQPKNCVYYDQWLD